jgi:hypothetical protein
MLYVEHGEARKILQTSGETILVSIQTVLSYCLMRISHTRLERCFGYFGYYVSTAKGSNAVKLKCENGLTS